MAKRRFDSPEEAESAFYQAFETADLESMMDVWAEDETIACIHPMGQMLYGHSDVREGWRQLFAGEQRMHFQLAPHQHNREGKLAVHLVTENIFLHGDSNPRPPILATNIYVQTEQGWRMVLHHASPSVIDTTNKYDTPPEAPSALH